MGNPTSLEKPEVDDTVETQRKRRFTRTYMHTYTHANKHAHTHKEIWSLVLKIGRTGEKEGKWVGRDRGEVGVSLEKKP